MASQPQVSIAHTFGRTLTGGILAIAVLFFADTFLAKTEKAESLVEAEHHYQNGKRLMQSGDTARAVEEFRSALGVERENQDYQLALGQALLTAGKATDAAGVLNALLEEDPFGGPANLALARVMVREGKIADAISYYHRAIYGQWKDNAAVNQLQVRFELVELLSRQNSGEALLAELLPLQDEAPDDVATQEKLGQWFLAAGSTGRAAGVFREILQRGPRNADVHAGLAEAEFASGNYREARDEFQAAVRMGAGDETIQARLDLANRILDLDPTLRGLSREERLRRSRKLLELTLDDLKQCTGDSPLIKPAEIAMRKPMTTYDDNLDLADRIWQARRTNCKGSSNAEPFAIVLSKLGQK